ncbi:DsrE family protein [Roseibaca sp. V10]|uniref:DsrE family protein n=1 Tax=Roseinatronobacter domitianus TaxID=2940293 RepID=A0ABT0M0W1_9RHOB|nr:DsrE family protein [Roseibaca domitiana]MCL1628499.1 DsrE family protein [Roseibaca domitiana]
MQKLIRAGFAATVLALAPLAAWAEAAKVAIHVDEESIQTMNMALNNAANIIKHYEDLGQEVTVEIVTYGPGLHMLRADTSPVSDRIATMSLTHDNISFSACLNTVQAMQQRAQTDIPLLSEANVVPSGAVRLMELQYEGYAYLRP